MATVVDGQYTPLNGRMDSEDNGKKRNLLGDTQGDVVELSQMIAHPGMRKAESMEVLNLSIHQASSTFSFLSISESFDVQYSVEIPFSQSLSFVQGRISKLYASQGAPSRVVTGESNNSYLGILNTIYEQIQYIFVDFADL